MKSKSSPSRSAGVVGESVSSLEEGLPKLNRGASPDLLKNGSEELCGKKERDVFVDSVTEGAIEPMLPLAALSPTLAFLRPEQLNIAAEKPFAVIPLAWAGEVSWSTWYSRVFPQCAPSSMVAETGSLGGLGSRG